MTVELRPLGVKCNIQCQYCYQNPQRDAGNVGGGYDIDRMKAAIEAEGGPFALFGGEALLVPEDDLETLWAWGLEKYGSNSVQSNGVLINDTHVRLFKQYKVHVGISLDGPGELNDARWSGTVARTRENTEKTHRAIERLCREGIPPSLIVTLHQCNATRDKLPVMCDWLLRMEALGVTAARLHLLEINHPAVQNHYALSVEENLAALQAFAALERRLTTLRLDVFDDMRNMLLGRDDTTTCIWNACDPYTTRAVRGVEGNGQRSNCGRTNKDGIEFVKAGVEGFERYVALYHTPQEHGGCQGCRFFLQCKGQCPGTAIDADWRNRTEHCGVWMAGFAAVERELLDRGETPLSLSPLRGRLEGYFLSEWAAGRKTTLAHAVKQVQGEAVSPPTWPAPPPAPAATGGIAADRLDFALHDFTRVSWVSQETRAVWGGRVQRLRDVWPAIEWRSVADGVRACALLPDGTTGQWAGDGLEARSVEGSGQLVIGRPAEVDAFLRAWAAGDAAAMGRLLGQPACCLAFQYRVWAELGLEDTTWPMALAGGPPTNGGTLLEMTGPPQTNVLWRWLGVRPVPHLPCGPTCPHTVALADRLAEVGRRAGFAAEMDWLAEILSWPVEWSSLHGIAEVRTPVLKISTRTDPLARAYVVRRHGDHYPDEGANALRFPYRQARAPLLTLSHGFRRGLENAADLAGRATPTEARP